MAEKLREKTFCKLVENMIFREKTFADCSLVWPTNATLPNFTEKTFANSHKNFKVFLFESFPLYSEWKVSCVCHESPAGIEDEAVSREIAS